MGYERVHLQTEQTKDVTLQQQTRLWSILVEKMSQWSERQRRMAGLPQHDGEWQRQQHVQLRGHLRKAQKSLSTHKTFLICYDNIRTRLLLLLALLFWSGLLQQLQARADVGIEAQGLHSAQLQSELHQAEWLLTEDGCTIGEARHLVVDPGTNDNFLEPQPLRGDMTGPALCQWLDAMIQFHLSQRRKWEERHEMKKRTVGGLLYLLRRLKLHFRKFPQFEVKFFARHVDIWHDDRFGRPMPWASGYFCYVTHEEKEESYGVFSLSTPACFQLAGTDASEGEKTLVHLLLNPHRRVNRRMEQHERRVPNKVKGALVGAVSGLVTGASVMLDKDYNPRIKAYAGAYLRLFNFPKISLQIRDFWVRGSSCYIRNRFWIPGKLGLILCQSISKRGVQRGAYSLWKAHKTESVQVSLVDLDLFHHPEARLTVVVSEGVLLSLGSEKIYTIAFDTDPAVIPEYVYAMRAARFFSVPLAVGQTFAMGKTVLDMIRQ